MRLSIHVKIAFIVFVLLNILFAESNDTTSVTFPIRYNWLEQQYTPVDIYQTRGLNLISDNYVALNRHLYQININGLKSETTVDSSGQNIFFTSLLDDYDLYWPVAMSVDEYYRLKTQQNLREKVRLMGIENTKVQEKKGTGRGLEILGADIAGQRVALRVSGNINISGQMNNRETSTVASNIQEGKSTDFKIDQTMRFNIEGTIGDRISILVDQDSERSFDFENAMKIIYTGKEDEIVQSVQAGNISLSLPGTKFVTFSSKSNGLFGLKADLKFGPVNVTTIASVEKGEKQKLSYEGGSEKTEIEINDYDYIRNKYFFLDMDFRNGIWPNFWANGMFIGTNEVVADFEVYKSVVRKTANSLYGTAYVDPNNTSQFNEESETTYFEKLVEDKDYSYSRDLGYLVMNRAYMDEIIAVAYTVRDRNSESLIQGYGDWDHNPADSTISLKLIQPRTMSNDEHPCWDLMFRNVYYLGSTSIDSTGFDVQVMYDGPSGFVPRDPVDGETYLEKFGLDEIDASGNKGKDDYVDLTTGLVRLRSGELWMPFLHPFKYDVAEGGEGNESLSEEYSSSKMYEVDYRSRKNEIVEESKFRIIVRYENRSSVLQLGPMIMEGSEEVTLNGRTLMKGTDYDIEYMSGMLTLYDPMATSPDAKLDVKFEKNSFFQLKKKTILGARAQYDFGQDNKNFIGATGLYYSKSTVDDKVEVGYEPMANFVFDVNGRIQQDLNFLTKGIDRLPLISTDKKSMVTIEGEVARVLPNPNTSNNKATGDNNGVAYIDDFEGSKRTISPVLTKSFWARSAPPEEKSEYTDTENAQNWLSAHTFWYIDYDGVSIKQIWPDKNIGTGASQQERNVNPLYLNIEPGAAPEFGEKGTAEQKREAWGGITYFFPSSNWDQSKTKFIDIWMKGTEGNLHIDLGTISEDQVPDDKMNTEDWYNDFANDIYDDGEDIGLDKLKDEDETLVVKDPITGVIETLAYGDSKLADYGRTQKDPHLDNFNYQQGSTDIKYLRTVNGTEDNEKDGGSNHRPDLEDKNNNLAIDTDNNYRSVSIPLDDNDNRFLDNEANEYGWKLYRIPIIEFENMNGFSEEAFAWENIQAFRIWMDGCEDELASIAIAKVEMVRNEWESMGVAEAVSYDDVPDFVDANTDSGFKPMEKVFTTTVKNTEENDDYSPPKDVKGEYDKVNQVQRKEQSLVLKIYDVDEVVGASGLWSMELASAEKDLLEELSLINYKKMKMYLTAENVTDGHNYIDGEKTPLVYFLRFGKGGSSAQYFEIRQPVYAGWDYNEFEVDLDFMTSLKQWNNEDDYIPKNQDGLKEFWIRDHDKYDQVRIYKEVKNGDYSGKEIIIYSTPSISRIKRMETGIINMGNSPVFGEVWLNELRLSDVRKEAGTAARASFAINFADLADFNFNAETKDADFHTVEQQPSSNATSLADSKTYNATSRLYLHKFFPSKWGLSLPVSTTMNYSEKRPKYLPGTDILAGENPADSISSLSQGYGFNTSVSKRVSDFWLTKYTIDQLKLNFSLVHNQMSSKDIEIQESDKYSAGLSYQIPFGRDTYFQLFKWAENIPVLKNYSDMKLYYAPEKFSYNMNTAENMSEKIPRNVNSDTVNTHIMSMNQTVDFAYKLTDNIKAGYNLTLKNNMDEIVEDKWSNFQKFKFGTNEDYQERYSFSFNPALFSWFKPQMTYASTYNWSEPISSQTEYVDRLTNSNNMSVSGSIDIAQVFKSLYAPGGAKKSGSSGKSRSTRGGSPRRNTRGKQPEDGEEKKAEKPKGDHPLLNGIHTYLDKISAVSATYTVNNSIASNYREMGHAGWDYRLGFSQDPGLDTVNALTGVNNPQTATTLSLRSGLELTKQIKTTFSYSYKNTSSINQGIEKETIAEDYFPSGEFGDKGFAFPNWQVKVSGLEKIPGADKIFKSFSISHGFSGKKSQNFKDGDLLTSNFQSRFSPLVSLSMKFKMDINSNLSLNTTNSITNGESGVDRANTFGISGDISYKRKGGITIPLPFMEKKRLDNNIDFSMGFEYSTSKAEQKTHDMEKYSSKDDRMTMSIKPRIGYSFTQKVTGGIFFQYQKQDDARIGERNNMNYGFDVNIKIQG